MMSVQVVAGLAQVVQLLGEERVPLAAARRTPPAPAGSPCPARARLRSAARSRFSCSARDVGHRVGRRVVLGQRRCRRAWSAPGPGWSGPYSADQHLGVQAELGQRLLGQRLDPHLLLRRGPARRGGRCRPAPRTRGQLAAALPDGRQLGLGLGAALLRRACARVRGQRPGRLDALGQPVGGRAGRPRPPRPRGAAARGGPRPCARACALGLRRPAARLSARPARARARSSTVRSASRASISAGAGRAGRGRRERSRSVGSASPTSVWAEASSSRASSSPRLASRLVAGRAPPSRSAAASRPASRLGRADGLVELAGLLGERGVLGVRLVQPGQRGVRALACGRRARARPAAQREPQPLDLGLGCAEPARSASSTAACTSSSDGLADEPPAANHALSRSPSRVTAVTSGSCGDQRRGRVGRSSTTATLHSSRSIAGRRLGVARRPASTGVAGARRQVAASRRGRRRRRRRRAAARPGRGPRP